MYTPGNPVTLQQLREANLVISDEDLRLIPWRLQDDAPLWQAIDYDREHLTRYAGIPADKYKTVGEVTRDIIAPLNPHYLRFGIWPDELDDQVVGTATLEPVTDEEAWIGYWIGAEHTGHGYALRALRALSRYAFETLRYDKLTGNVVCENIASQRVLEKAGYTATSGTTRHMLTDHTGRYILRECFTYTLPNPKPTPTSSDHTFSQR